MEGFELDSCGSGYGQVAGIGESGKEVSRSIKCQNYSSLGEDPLTLKQDSTATIYSERDSNYAL